MYLSVLIMGLSVVFAEEAPLVSNTTTQVVTNALKSKRGVSYQTRVPGENTHHYKPLIYYADTVPSAGSYPASKPLYPVQNHHIKPLLVQDSPKQVTAQQVLYEYQQTPHASVSNVLVNQQYQPVPQPPQEPSSTRQHELTRPLPDESSPSHVVYDTPYTPTHLNQFVNNPYNLQGQSNQYSAETAQHSVVNPIQHSTYINHAPYTVPPTGSPQQGRYLYVNGKVLYQNYNPHVLKNAPAPAPGPVHPQYQRYLQQQHKQPQPAHYNRPVPASPASVAPVMFSNYQNQNQDQEARRQPEEIDRPSKQVQQDEQVDEEEVADDKEDVRQDNEEVRQDNEEVEEDDDEERSNYKNKQEQDEEQEEEHPFERYQFDGDEEEEDHEGYTEEGAEEEDDDNDGGSSRYVIKTPKKYHQQKYVSTKPVKVYEKYHHKPQSSKYSTKSKKTTNSPKNKEYKSYTVSKGSPKPKSDRLEGKQSQNIPIAVHKFYKEKWYVTKSH